MVIEVGPSIYPIFDGLAIHHAAPSAGASVIKEMECQFKPSLENPGLASTLGRVICIGLTNPVNPAGGRIATVL
jgi:hypothetical protein